MKRRNVILVSLLLLLAIAPLQIKANTETSITANKPESAVPTARTTELMTRLDEINALDKSAMSRLEKKDAREEVREIKKELKENSGGIYISAGAIIIILLLIILL
jgi:hypothetical protein